jgi:hypothetical protein
VLLRARPAVADYRVQLRLGDIARELTFGVAPEERAEAAKWQAIRTAHRAFLKGAVACAMCHAAVDPDEVDGQLWSCRSCGAGLRLPRRPRPDPGILREQA